MHLKIFLLELFDLVLEFVVFSGKFSFLSFHFCNILVSVLRAKDNEFLRGEEIFPNVEKSVRDLGMTIG